MSEEVQSGIERQFEAIQRKLDRLDEAIRGNGKPGILIRLDRLEQNARRQARLIWLFVGAAIAAGMSLLISWMSV